MCHCNTSNVNRRRRKEQVKMRSSLSPLRGRSTTRTVRLERRTFRVTQRWSWQERLQRETRLKRYMRRVHLEEQHTMLTSERGVEQPAL